MQFRRHARKPGGSRRLPIALCVAAVTLIILIVVLRWQPSGQDYATGLDGGNDGVNRNRAAGEGERGSPEWQPTAVPPAIEREIAQLRWTSKPRRGADTDNPRSLLADIAQHLKRLRHGPAPTGGSLTRSLLRPRYATLSMLKEIDITERTQDISPIISTLADHDAWGYPQVARVDELWRLQESKRFHLTISRDMCDSLRVRAPGLSGNARLGSMILTRQKLSVAELAAVDDLCRILAGYFIGGTYRDADVVWAGALDAVQSNIRGDGVLSMGPRPLAFFAIKRFHPCFKSALAVVAKGMQADTVPASGLAPLVEKALLEIGSEKCPSLARVSPFDVDSRVIIQWSEWSGIPRSLRFGMVTAPLNTTSLAQWEAYQAADPSTVLAPLTGRTVGLVSFHQTAEATGSFPAPFPATNAFDRDLTTFSATAEDGLNDRLIVSFGDGLVFPWSMKTEKPKLHCVSIYAPREERFVNALVGVRIELLTRDSSRVVRTSFRSKPVHQAVTSYKVRITHDDIDDATTLGTVVHQIAISRAAGPLRLAEVQIFVDDASCSQASALEVLGARSEFVSTSSSDPVADVIGLVEVLKRRTYDCPSTRSVSWSDSVEYVVCADVAPLIVDQCGVLTIVHNQFPHLVDEGLSVTAAANGCQFVAMFTDPIPDHMKDLNYTVLHRTLHSMHEVRSTDIELKTVIKGNFKKKHVDVLHIDYHGREAWLAQELIDVARDGLVDHVFLHIQLREAIASDPLEIASHVAFVRQLLRHYEIIGSSVTPKSRMQTVFRTLPVPLQWQISLLRKGAIFFPKPAVKIVPKTVQPAQMTFAPAADANESDAVFEAGRLPFNASHEFPRVMHTIWKTVTLPVAGVKLDETWRKQETGLDFQHHTDEDCMALAQRFPVLGPRYAALGLKVMRADICRLLVIYYNGGLYRDLDVRWVRPLSDWIDWSKDAIYGNEDEHYCQWFFGAKKHNPCIFRTLVHITRLLRDFKLDFRSADKDLVIEVTGPGAFTVGMQGCPAPPSLTPLDLTQKVVWHEFAAMNWGQGYSSWLVQRDRLAGWRRMPEGESRRVEYFEKPSNQVLAPFATGTAIHVISVQQTSQRYGGLLDINPAQLALDRNADTFVIGTDKPDQSWTVKFQDPFKMARQQMTQNAESARYDLLEDVPLESRLACIRIHQKRRFSDQEHSNAVSIQLLDSQDKIVFSTPEFWRMHDTVMNVTIATNVTSSEVKTMRVHKNFGSVLIAEVEFSPAPDCSTAHRLVGHPTPEVMLAPAKTERKWAWVTAWTGLQLMRTTIDCSVKVLAFASEYHFYLCPAWLPKSLTVLHLVTHAPKARYNFASLSNQTPNVQYFQRGSDCAAEGNCVVKTADLLTRPIATTHRMIVVDVDELESENTVAWKVLGRLVSQLLKKGDADAPDFVLLRWRFPVSDPAIFTKTADSSPDAPGPLTSNLVNTRLGVLLRFYELYATHPVDYREHSRCSTSALMMGSLLYECVDVSLVKKSFVHRVRQS